MIYARYLAVGGFKSLRDWNLLEFSPGVSVIVGGNGTGKSSLVEALLWCLGEDDPGRLRASDFHDLLWHPPQSHGLAAQRRDTEQHIHWTHKVEERAAAEEAELTARQEAPGVDEAAAYLVLGDTSDLGCDEDERHGCCCKQRTGQHEEIPDGVVSVGRSVAPNGLTSWAVDGEPADREAVVAALGPHGLDRSSVKVIRQGELERLLVVDDRSRTCILAETSGLSLGAAEPYRHELIQVEAEIEWTEEQLRLLERGSDASRDAVTDAGAQRVAVVVAALEALDAEPPLPGGRDGLLALLGLPGEFDLLQATNAGTTRGEERPETPQPTGDKRRSELEENRLGLLSRRTTLLDMIGATRDAERASIADLVDRVEQRFARAFASLVPGGSVSLRLTSGDHGAAATPQEPPATQVQVSFPGQPRVSLDALSGGQRALVAFSLGLAFFGESSARLLVFDEVEPALDETNLRRFNDLLHEESKEHQIVIVSHQRRTKEVGDVVFGVDHLGDGASALLFRFEPATKRLVMFGRVRGNWIDRTAQLERDLDEDGPGLALQGPRSLGMRREDTP